MAESFPLEWPTGYPRTNHRKPARFSRSLANSRDDLLAQIKRLGGTQVVISSNAKLKNDGRPYSKQSRVDDPGVAVYFFYEEQQVVFACDKWVEIGENIRALGLAIEAIRGLERWGVSEMLKRAFAGFKALPEPSSSWRQILQVTENADWTTVEAAYKKRRKEAHPDNGGSSDEFTAVQAAHEKAKIHYKQ